MIFLNVHNCISPSVFYIIMYRTMYCNAQSTQRKTVRRWEHVSVCWAETVWRVEHRAWMLNAKGKLQDIESTLKGILCVLNGQISIYDIYNIQIPNTVGSHGVHLVLLSLYNRCHFINIIIILVYCYSYFFE